MLETLEVDVRSQLVVHETTSSGGNLLLGTLRCGCYCFVIRCKLGYASAAKCKTVRGRFAYRHAAIGISRSAASWSMFGMWRGMRHLAAPGWWATVSRRTGAYGGPNIYPQTFMTGNDALCTVRRRVNWCSVNRARLIYTCYVGSNVSASCRL